MKKYSDAEAIHLIDIPGPNNWKSLFIKSPHPIAYFSCSGKFLRVNRAFCDLIEFSDIELYDKNFSELTHPEDIGTSWDNLKKLMHSDCEYDSYSIVKRFLTKTNKTIPCFVSVFVIKDDKDNPIYFVKYVIPIKNGLANKISDVAKILDQDENKKLKEKLADFAIDHWYKLIPLILCLIGFYYKLIEINSNLESGIEKQKEAVISREQFLKDFRELSGGLVDEIKKDK